MVPRRVLVADDEQRSADLLKEIIESEHPGDVVDVAYDGAQALAMAEANRPDIAVLDLEMPLLDGQAAAERIKARYADHPPVLVALSGNVSRLAAMRPGHPFARLLRKPLDVDELFAAFA